MRVPLDPSSTAPNRGPRVPLSVGPVYERESGRAVGAGVLAIADGIARAEGGSPAAGLCGMWQSTPRHAVPGDVIVMKGALHPGHRGAVHRSPPIEGTGRIRVVPIASTVEGS